MIKALIFIEHIFMAGTGLQLYIMTFCPSTLIRGTIIPTSQTGILRFEPLSKVSIRPVYTCRQAASESAYN